MKVVEMDEKHGFVSRVSYTDDRMTKHFNIKYNFETPNIFSDIGTVFNFKEGNWTDNDRLLVEDGNKGSNLNTKESNITAYSTNKGDMKGNQDIITTHLTKGLGNGVGEQNDYVEFTAKDDLYEVPDATIKRYVNIFKEPDWEILNGRKIQMGQDITYIQPIKLTDKNGNNYEAKITNKSDINVNKPGTYNANYKASGMLKDFSYEPAFDYGTKKEISYRKL